MSRGSVKLPCIEHRCPRYAVPGASRCEEHQAAHVAGRWDRGSTGARGSTWSWRKLRELVWREQGKRCGHCRKYASRFELHHIDGDARNNARDNLVALCVPCHRAIPRTKKRRPR